MPKTYSVNIMVRFIAGWKAMLRDARRPSITMQRQCGNSGQSVVRPAGGMFFPDF
jgi:hypothetical protein